MQGGLLVGFGSGVGDFLDTKENVYGAIHSFLNSDKISADTWRLIERSLVGTGGGCAARRARIKRVVQLPASAASHSITETFIPPFLLAGLLPEALVLRFFWWLRSGSGGETLVGYPAHEEPLGKDQEGNLTLDSNSLGFLEHQLALGTLAGGVLASLWVPDARREDSARERRCLLYTSPSPRDS